MNGGIILTYQKHIFKIFLLHVLFILMKHFYPLINTLQTTLSNLFNGSKTLKQNTDVQASHLTRGRRTTVVQTSLHSAEQLTAINTGKIDFSSNAFNAALYALNIGQGVLHAHFYSTRPPFAFPILFYISDAHKQFSMKTANVEVGIISRLWKFLILKYFLLILNTAMRRTKSKIRFLQKHAGSNYY